MTRYLITYDRSTDQFINTPVLDSSSASAIDNASADNSIVPARLAGEPIADYAKRLLASNISGEIDAEACPQPEAYESAPAFCERLLASGYVREGLDVKTYLSRFVKAQGAIRACACADLGDQVAALKGLK